jgi:hypothetical protein
MYVMRLLAQADHVLSNELQLGQYVHVDHDLAYPIHVIVGAGPLPGHHPLVTHTPDLSMRAKLASPRNGSGASSRSPTSSPPCSTSRREDAGQRADGLVASGQGAWAAATHGREQGVTVSPALSFVLVRKSSNVQPRLPRSKSFVAERD